MVQKKIIVSVSKADLIDHKTGIKISNLKFKGVSEKPIIFSSITGSGLDELMDILWKNLQKEKA